MNLAQRNKRGIQCRFKCQIIKFIELFIKLTIELLVELIRRRHITIITFSRYLVTDEFKDILKIV